VGRPKLSAEVTDGMAYANHKEDTVGEGSFLLLRLYHLERK